MLTFFVFVFCLVCFSCTVYVGWIMVPPNIHILICGTCECVRLQSKGELKLQMELRDQLTLK